MATYHCHVSIKKRAGSATFSAVQGAAYRSGDALFDERLERAFSFKNREDINHVEILAPNDAPEWVQDRQALWNAVENSENRKDAQMYREVILALPRELTLEQNRAVVTDWARREFVSHGLIADVAFHGHEANVNPHAHVMVTMRTMTAEGLNPHKAVEFNSYENPKSGFKVLNGEHPFEAAAIAIRDRRYDEAIAKWEDGKAAASNAGEKFEGKKPNRAKLNMVEFWRPSWEEALNKALSDAGTGGSVSAAPKREQKEEQTLENTSIPRDALAMEQRGELTRHGDRVTLAQRKNDAIAQMRSFDKSLAAEQTTYGAFVSRIEHWWGSIKSTAQHLGSAIRDATRTFGRSVNPQQQQEQDQGRSL